jgi:hypothetical protein
MKKFSKINLYIKTKREKMLDYKRYSYTHYGASTPAYINRDINEHKSIVGPHADACSANISIYVEETVTEAVHGDSTLNLLRKASDITGGYIKFNEEYCFCPVLVGSDSKPIFLYEFIEVLDESTDYKKIKELLPTLSFSKIYAAISFLRKVAQLNSMGIDIDGYLDEKNERSDEFLEELKIAYADKEVAYVLNFD